MRAVPAPGPWMVKCLILTFTFRPVTRMMAFGSVMEAGAWIVVNRSPEPASVTLRRMVSCSV